GRRPATTAGPPAWRRAPSSTSRSRAPPPTTSPGSCAPSAPGPATAPGSPSRPCDEAGPGRRAEVRASPAAVARLRPDLTRAPSMREGVAPPAVAVVGPTATGKTALGLALARRLGGAEIVSADALVV